MKHLLDVMTSSLRVKIREKYLIYNFVKTKTKLIDLNTWAETVIAVPIDPHCNLPQNKTHSYVSRLIVDPGTLSRRENAPDRMQVQRKK